MPKLITTARPNDSIPPEFKGSGGGFSPEDLFNQTLANCFAATFKVYAENSKLTFADVVVEAKLAVDMDDNKKAMMKEFYLVATKSACNYQLVSNGHLDVAVSGHSILRYYSLIASGISIL